MSEARQGADDGGREGRGMLKVAGREVRVGNERECRVKTLRAATPAG